MLCLQWDRPSPERLLWDGAPGVCHLHVRSKFSLNPGYTKYYFFLHCKNTHKLGLFMSKCVGML